MEKKIVRNVGSWLVGTTLQRNDLKRRKKNDIGKRETERLRWNRQRWFKCLAVVPAADPQDRYKQYWDLPSPSKG
jgi:hypothetical protein